MLGRGYTRLFSQNDYCLEVKVSMTEGQAYLLKLFKEVAEICEKNGIRYYLAGGTLIGAIRHRGFVPWDDDFDLYMTRDEFNKFVEVAKHGGLPSNRVLECQELNRTYRNVFARYTDISTSSIHKNQLISDDIAGEVLDILQLDPVPNNKKIREKYFKRLMLYADLINPSVCYSSRCGWNKYVYPYYRIMTTLFGKEKVLNHIERKLFQFNEEECDTYIMRWSGAPLIFDKDIFEPALNIPFEGILSTIPKGFNKYLVDHYGDDWVFVPKVNEQMSHEAVHSLMHDYTVIRKSYEQYIDKKQILKKYEKRKLNILFSVDRSHWVADRIVNMRGIRIKQDLINQINRKCLPLEQWYHNGEYIKIQKLFNNYFNLQCSAQFIGRDTFKNFYRFQNPILIDLPIDMLKIVLMVQHETGKTGKVNRILEVYKIVKGNLPIELQEVQYAIDKQREAVNLYSYGYYEKSLEIVEELQKKYSRNISLIKLMIRILFKMKKSEKDIKTMINVGKTLYPEDGEFIKYEADLIFGKDKEKACELYEYAKEKTENGCVLLEINDNIKIYTEFLYKKMKKELETFKYEDAKETYRKINVYSNDEKIDLEYYKGIICCGMTNNEKLDIWQKLINLNNLFTCDDQNQILIRILSHCGEVPFIAKEHIEIIRLNKNDELDSMPIRKRIEEKIKISHLKGWKQSIPKLRKLLADLDRREGKILEAYFIYRDIYTELEDTIILKNELKELFEKDIKIFHLMKEEFNVNSSEIYPNFFIKFGTEDMVQKILNYFGIESELKNVI